MPVASGVNRRTMVWAVVMILATQAWFIAIVVWGAVSGSFWWPILALRCTFLMGVIGALAFAWAQGRRFTLRMAVFAIAAIAIFLADLAQHFQMGRFVASADVEVADGDAGAMAREILSPAVVDDALNGGLASLPRFAGTADPQAELLRSLSVRHDPGSHSIKLSMEEPSSHTDALMIFDKLLQSCAGRLGVKPPEFRLDYARAEVPGQTLVLLFAWYLWTLLFFRPFRRRREPAAGTLNGTPS